MEDLLKKLIEVTLTQPYIGERVPEAWLNFEKAVIKYVHGHSPDSIRFVAFRTIRATFELELSLTIESNEWDGFFSFFRLFVFLVNAVSRVFLSGTRPKRSRAPVPFTARRYAKRCVFCTVWAPFSTSTPRFYAFTSSSMPNGSSMLWYTAQYSTQHIFMLKWLKLFLICILIYIPGI